MHFIDVSDIHALMKCVYSLSLNGAQLYSIMNSVMLWNMLWLVFYPGLPCVRYTLWPETMLSNSSHLQEKFPVGCNYAVPSLL